MSSLREIREHIDSVRDTAKITGAMYMISSNKLRKARRMLEETEDYFLSLRELIRRISENIPEGAENVFLKTHADIAPEMRRKGYLILSADKGLAGAYNGNILRLALKHIREDNREENYRLYVVGELGRHFFMSHGLEVDRSFNYTAQNPTMHRARQISASIIDDYRSGRLDEVYLVYTVMEKGAVCEARFEKLLPLSLLTDAVRRKEEAGTYYEEFMMRPSPGAVLDNVVPNYVNGYIYGALVETYCSEQQSRMVAMEAAGRNAEEMIGQLSREYNRERQDRITQEITEVVGGARALRRGRHAGGTG